MAKQYEIRDPIHGFVTLNEWERDIINLPAFQRLRRIRQLSLTDMVYPGAMHTRFEHSLGVMHVVTRMFDSLVTRERDFLKSESVGFNDEGLKRDRSIVRLAALLHDCGHAPFSHAAEDLMPENPTTKKKYKHEGFSTAIIRTVFKDIIEEHKENQNHGIKAEDVAQLIDEERTVSLGRRALWKSLISSQLDADRSDYLLRDSYHAGVAYGHYDLDRLIVTLRVGLSEATETPLVAIDKSGIHVAEALIIARYMMFTQVYFQKTRRIYDLHLQEAMRNIFKGGKFPVPDSKEALDAYLDWDDWRVMGCLKDKEGKEAGRKLLERDHDRMVLETSENPSREEIAEFESKKKSLIEKIPESIVDCASAKWYKTEANEIGIFEDEKTKRFVELSKRSNVVKGLMSCGQMRLYVPNERRAEAKATIATFEKKS
jgi:HD superfamily phosphohydrolase